MKQKRPFGIKSTSKGVVLVSLKEGFDTVTSHGRFMLTVFGARVEPERESIREHQREGIENAKAKGKHKGRKPAKVNEAKFRAVCSRWHAGEITAIAAIQKMHFTFRQIHMKIFRT